MSYTKYTKATTIFPHDTNPIDPRPDAVYVGDGNYTDGHTWDDFYEPNLWYRGDEDMVAGSPGTWDNHAQGNGSIPVRSSQLSVDGPTIDTGDATTNGKPYWTFAANADHMTTSDTPASFNIGTGEFEMMAVVRFGDNGDKWQHIASRDSGASNWSWLRRSDGAGTNAGLLTISLVNNEPVSATAPAYDTWYILGVSRDGSNNVQLWRDGEFDGVSAGNSEDLDDDSVADLYIGAKGPGTQSILGDMAEFILWEKVLTTAERLAIVNHLQGRYFNAKRAKLLVQDVAGDASTIDTIYPKVGEVNEISPNIIRSTSTVATNVVALYKK